MPGSRPRSNSPALTLLLCLVLLALGAGGAGVLRGPSRAHSPEDGPAASAEAGLRASDAGFDRARPASPQVQLERSAIQVDPEAPALALQVFDPEGVPVPDLDCTVFCEAPVGKVLARATTDQAGRIWVHPLPEGVVLVQTSRQPPYASTLDAVWMNATGVQERSLTLRRGGKVYGRVVDEDGVPQPEVPLALLSQSPGTLRRQELARSDGSGAFEIPALASTPRGVWVVEEEARPEHVDPLVLAFEWPGGQRSRRFTLDEGQVLNLGDVVLPSVRTLVGRVLGPDDRPVAGALVSTDPDFDPAPLMWWNEPLPDRPGPSQTFTDSAGRFRLMDASRGRQDVVVIGPDRHFLRTRNPPRSRVDTAAQGGDLHVGEAQDGAAQGRDPQAETLLRLPEQCRVRLELTQQDGSGFGGAPRHGMLEVRAQGLQGPLSARTAYAFPLPGGKDWALELPHDSRQVHALELPAFGPGFAPLLLPGDAAVLRTLRHQVPEPVVAAPQRASLSLRFRLSEPMGLRDRLHVRCCLAPPERQQGGPLAPCCGLGAQGSVTLGAKQVAVHLQPRIEGRYWLVLSKIPPADPPIPATFLGPFATGPQTHEIELDTSAWHQSASAATAATAPPAPLGSLRVRLLDEGGRPLPAVHLSAHCTEPSGRRVDFHEDGPVGDGVAQASMPEGEWTMSFQAPGYEPSPPRAIRIQGGQTREISLSLARRTPRILRAGMPPSPASLLLSPRVSLLHAGSSLGARQTAPGDFEVDWSLPLDPPGSWWWMVSGQAPAHLPSDTLTVPYAQRFDQAPRDAQLSRPHFVHVEIQLHGMQPEHRFAGLRLLLRQPELPEWRFSRVHARPVADPGSTTQRAHLWITPGRYTLRSQSALYRLAEQELVVPAGEDSLLVEISLRR